MSETLLTAWILLAWGASAVTPWRLAALPPESRRIWGLATLPLLLSGALAAARQLALHPDAAAAQGLGQLRGSPFALATASLLAALLLALLLATWAGAKLEANGWRLIAGFGALFLLAGSLGGELLRVGETQVGGLGAFFALVLCRFLLALGAAEVLAPGPQRFGLPAALALVASLLLQTPPIPRALLANQGYFPFAAGAILFATARWLPVRLRRPALAGATLLAGLALTLAADLTHSLGAAPMP